MGINGRVPKALHGVWSMLPQIIFKGRLGNGFSCVFHMTFSLNKYEGKFNS